MKMGLKLMAAALAMSVCVADCAEAFGRRHGSSGSSGGSFGSSRSSDSVGSSGSSGSYGSGGSSGSRRSRGSRGSSGSHGSSGSSGGSYSSYGSGGSSGGSGSSGGVVYPSAASSHFASGYLGQPVIASVEVQDKAQLLFNVPEDAVIYMSGQKTASGGEFRKFNSPVLKPGKKFGYPIRVELTRDGKTFTAEGMQIVRANDRIELNIEFDAQLGQLSLTQAPGQKSILKLVQRGPQAAPLVSQK